MQQIHKIILYSSRFDFEILHALYLSIDLIDATDVFSFAYPLFAKLPVSQGTIANEINLFQDHTAWKISGLDPPMFTFFEILFVK